MAGMRLSGLMSGMDTESIISQLVEARKTKVNTQKKAQIKVNYKQDAWNSRTYSPSSSAICVSHPATAKRPQKYPTAVQSV